MRDLVVMLVIFVKMYTILFYSRMCFCNGGLSSPQSLMLGFTGEFSRLAGVVKCVYSHYGIAFFFIHTWEILLPVKCQKKIK